MASPQWAATYENTEFISSSEHQAYLKIDRSRQYLFELLAENGEAVHEWLVMPHERLLLAGRNTINMTGQYFYAVIVGLEQRESDSVTIWRFSPSGNGVNVETRTHWPTEGEDGYSDWKRPIPIDGDE